LLFVIPPSSGAGSPLGSPRIGESLSTISAISLNGLDV